ncbi:fibrobacter succinogenes major paralogous domain-containing protein [Arenicella sp.]|nr:fibrobacter succinogenes major paralogous domain-containing protein [Arenicella sp.]
MNKYLKIFGISTILLCCCAVQAQTENQSNDAPSLVYGSMTDERDGTVYKTIQIGEQVWFAENLNTTEYKDGTPIPLGDDVDVFSYDEDQRNFYFNPNGDSKNSETYGRLYTYAAATQGICPVGWRASTDVDWVIMEMALGMSVKDVLGHHFDRGRGAELAPKMMATNELWPDNEGANETGFGVLLAGYKTLAQGNHPSFAFFSERAYFLTTSLGPDGVFYDGTKPLNRAIRRNFEPDIIGINRDSNIPLGYGFSVRCVEGDYFPADLQKPREGTAEH